VRSSSSGLVTAGGRVFGAVGMGSTLALARAQAYERVSRVSFAGMQTRGDIAVGEKRGGA
jgi:phosphoribosylamine--glycine ligase